MSSPTLTWPGRGRSVVRDVTSGRWRFAEAHEAQAPLPALQILAEHGASAVPGNPGNLGDANLLLHAEAGDALRHLAATHRGRVRLVYIDPPYNTGHDFETYDDRADHAVWMACLEERILAARELLAPGGFFVVHLNVVEQAYLKVLLDEHFGRRRLVAQIAWQRSPDRTVLGQGHALVADQVEYLLVYVNGDVPADWPRPQRRAPFPPRTLRTYRRTLVPSTTSTLVDAFEDGKGERVEIHAHDGYDLQRVPVDAHLPDPELFPRLMRLTNQQPESTFQQELLRRMPRRDVLYRAEFVQARGKHAGARARHYLQGNVVLWLRDVAELAPDGSLVRVADLNNFWTTEEIPATGLAREGGVSLRRGKKPERLLERVLGAFSREGDWVLDFFGGSGPAAVAERLGRRWLIVEAGESAHTLCEPRLRRAVAASGGQFTVGRLAR